jgi:cell shape-determining protein MreC
MRFVQPLWSIGKDSSVNIAMLLPETQNAIIADLKKENAELKNLLERKEKNNVVLAYVLKKPPFTAYDSYIIDVGENNGVKIGNKVYASGNILIGNIAEVNNNSSKVNLYSSFGNKFDILIGQNNIEAIATGNGGGTFISIIPRDIKVLEGDIIVVPDIVNSVFGRVAKILIDPARAFSTIMFSQPINIYEQKWVLVSLDN